MAVTNLGRVVGKSAYEVAVDNGYVGTETEWLASLKGAQGIRGPQGPQGQTGPAGLDGVNGLNGTDGTTFTPSVSAAGIISWTNDGGKENPQSVNIKGPAGTTQWSGIEDKPFSTIGTGLSVSEGVLSADGGGGSSAVVVPITSKTAIPSQYRDSVKAAVISKNTDPEIFLDYYGMVYVYMGQDSSNYSPYNGIWYNAVFNDAIKVWIKDSDQSWGNVQNITHYINPYTAGTNITISNGVISAVVPTQESPIYKFNLADFSARVYEEADNADAGGKLVLMNDDVDGYNNIPLLGIYTNNSKESEEIDNLTITVANPAWDKIETLVQETVDNNGYFAFVVNGDE